MEHMAETDHEQQSSPPFKDGEPRKHHDSPPTLMGWAHCPNAKQILFSKPASMKKQHEAQCH